jgi:hypothetical protein
MVGFLGIEAEKALPGKWVKSVKHTRKLIQSLLFVECPMRQNVTKSAQNAPTVHFVTPLKICFTQNQRLVIQKAGAHGLLKRFRAMRSRQGTSFEYRHSIHNEFIFQKKRNKKVSTTFHL